MGIYLAGSRRDISTHVDRKNSGRLRALALTVCAIFLTTVFGCGEPLRGLRPEYPEERYYLCDLPPAQFRFVMVDSLQPTLRWESFPTEKDLKCATGEELSRISDVTYELRIATIGWSYIKKNLSGPYHKVEVVLKPSTNYFWTVRACFKVNSEPRCTEWSTLKMYWYLGFGGIYQPNCCSYRFQTPSQ